MLVGDKVHKEPVSVSGSSPDYFAGIVSILPVKENNNPKNCYQTTGQDRQDKKNVRAAAAATVVTSSRARKTLVPMGSGKNVGQ